MFICDFVVITSNPIKSQNHWLNQHDIVIISVKSHRYKYQIIPKQFFSRTKKSSSLIVL